MSFSSSVKDELYSKIPPARHCRIAELAAIVSFGGVDIERITTEDILQWETSESLLLRKCFTLIVKTFNIKGEFAENTVSDMTEAVSGATVTMKACCRRAYLRGAFLASGSMSDPNKSYHFEIVSHSAKMAEKIQELFSSFDVEGKVISRKNGFVFYIKDAECITDALNVMEAHVALMELENTRIMKIMRNMVNRQVNCDAANINKTLSAAAKQVEDIRFLMTTKEYKTLSDNMRQMAEMRIQYPEVSLSDLGEMFDPPLGKSGVNHRLRRLCEMAKRLKEENYDKEGN